MAKAENLTDLSDEELVTALAEAKAELFNLRFQLVTGKQENYAQIGHVRKNVARYLTILRAREIALAEAEESA